ncbi:hypothetical protein L1987_43712 [Smallanthus sonchifolius]|uniref:Uncharacterized protein n=1 Tax=Smallanthus sonchifolius TaxID=185202 RepID=A0ACB9GNP7_9ASTR|nr:hypothetical protein L1987_43712 [Smallanthus sonchifolius]
MVKVPTWIGDNEEEEFVGVGKDANKSRVPLADPPDCCTPKNKLTGEVILVHRGNYSFTAKAHAAEAACASAILIVNNQTELFKMVCEADETDVQIRIQSATVRIPAVMLPRDAGASLEETRKHFGLALAFSFLIAGIAAALSAFCYAELVRNTQIGVVKRELPKQLQKGNVFNIEAGKQALCNINSLSLFSNIEVNPHLDEKNEGGIIVEIKLKELEQKSAEVSTEWSIVPGRGGRPTLASIQPGGTVSFEHRNIKGLNRSLLSI